MDCDQLSPDKFSGGIFIPIAGIHTHLELCIVSRVVATIIVLRRAYDHYRASRTILLPGALLEYTPNLCSPDQHTLPC